MSDIINLLPDSVANQIAAGEVIQRPASVVKELVENSIDAEAGKIDIIIKDAGKTLIQINDNGCGMTETDARMAFERHATSKIRNANDLFSIKSMGFRGEALASIAAVAQVELKTMPCNYDIGTHIQINGCQIIKQEPVSCAKGSNFIVKNLFYNIPARRKFLKSNSTEFRHIINEFQRLSLANPQIEFTLLHNNQTLFSIKPSSIKQRIVSTIGKQIKNRLLPTETETPIIKIKGFTGTPEAARKTGGDQFFFINNRFMKSPYLHRAVSKAYENLIPTDSHPAYFLFLYTDPSLIDINIHPTKTEVKFEDEKMVWKILNASIRESLGRYNLVPSIDFDTTGQINIPVASNATTLKTPEIKTNPNYNPFEVNSNNNWEKFFEEPESPLKDNNPDNFTAEDEVLLLPSKSNSEKEPQQQVFKEETNQIHESAYFQIKGKYILTPVKSGLMIIDQCRAHERVIFDDLINKISREKSTSQKVLFCETLTLNRSDGELLKELLPELQQFGFEIESHGNSEFKITGVPSEFKNKNSEKFIEEILESCKLGELNPQQEIKDKLATILAKNLSMTKGEQLSCEEMNKLTGKLLQSSMPNYSPTGKVIITIIDNIELEKRFK
ncbi:DNA mismatch repair endonuclease MutL [Marinilabiliaceae bacterium ANBcel2]|nr:DNA mismatch repair endonuclease MutL [Marinilabiliaceae bacterium ANBcel2]